MNKIAFVLAVMLFCFSFPNILSAQCDSLASEIPNNQVDEDCDGIDELYLQLGPKVYLLEGQKFEMYFRNLILSKHPQTYVFEVQSTLTGTKSTESWQVTPAAVQVGEHLCQVTVKTPAGQFLASATTKMIVVPAAVATPPSDTQRIVLLGHSFIDQGYMPHYFRTLYEAGSLQPMKMYGSRTSWIGNNKHEGIGGASWQYYYNNPMSPFFFNGTFNANAYFDQYICSGCRPDYLMIHLDVADFCFPGILTGNRMDSIDWYVNHIYETFANPLVEALHAAAPKCQIGICLSPQPSAKDDDFVQSFGASSVLSDKYRWQKIVSRVKDKYIKGFSGREDERIWLLPIQMEVNDSTDFKAGDPVHPHPNTSTLDLPSGYYSIAKEVYAWVRHMYNLPPNYVHTNEPEDQSVLSFSPNPATDVLQMQAKGTKMIQVEFFTPSANLAYQQILEPTTLTQIRLTELSSGLYFVRVTLEDGRQITSKVVLK